MCLWVCVCMSVAILVCCWSSWWRAITFSLVQLQCSGTGTQLPSLPKHWQDWAQKAILTTPIYPSHLALPSILSLSWTPAFTHVSTVLVHISFSKLFFFCLLLFFHPLFCWDPQQQYCPSMHLKNWRLKISWWGATVWSNFNHILKGTQRHSQVSWGT